MSQLPNEIIYKIISHLDDDDDIERVYVAFSDHSYFLRSRKVEFHNNMICCKYCGEYSKLICSPCARSLEKIVVDGQLLRCKMGATPFIHTADKSREFIKANYKICVKFTGPWRKYVVNDRIAYDKNKWIDFEVAFKNIKKLQLNHCSLTKLMKTTHLPRYWIMLNVPCKIKKIYRKNFFWYKFNIACVRDKIKRVLEMDSYQ